MNHTTVVRQGRLPSSNVAFDRSTSSYQGTSVMLNYGTRVVTGERENDSICPNLPEAYGFDTYGEAHFNTRTIDIAFDSRVRYLDSVID